MLFPLLQLKKKIIIIIPLTLQIILIIVLLKKIVSLNRYNHNIATAIAEKKNLIIPLTLQIILIIILLKLPQISNPPSDSPRTNTLNYLPPVSIESFFITPTDGSEVFNIIPSLKLDKSDRTNCIPTKILKLPNKDILDQQAIFFNQSFSLGIFPSYLKTSKIIPTYKKGSRLECSNYRHISLLSNIGIILESLTYNKLYNLLEKNEVIFSFPFAFRQI